MEKLRSKINELKKKPINEAQTKEWLIRPFFEEKGWDFSDPSEVIPEDDDLAGKRCDYSFCIGSKSKLLVEAKPLTNKLEDNKMILEKLNYCSNTGVPLLVITNGDLYRIYYAELKGVGNDKLLFEFTISSEIDEDLLDKLSKHSIQNDSLLKYARNISLYTNVKKAVEKLFQSTNKSFISQINSLVKESLGHKFGDDDIDNALKQFRLEINTDLDVISQNNFDEKVEKSKKAGKAKEPEELNWTVNDQFNDGKWKSSLELYQKLIQELKSIGLIFTEKPTKFYIGLISDKSNFCQIHGQKSGLKIWINLNMIDISEHQSLKVRDVSNIGHWGMGNIECVVQNSLDFEWLIGLLKRAYEK